MNLKSISNLLIAFTLLSNLFSCLPSKKFKHANHPAAPDYSNEDSWVSLPWRFDAADCIPQNCPSPDNQDSAQVDVFYIYPTAYVFGTKWNAKVDSRRLMSRIDNLTESQASAFNACAKVYTPLYRQAILKSFLNSPGISPGLLAYKIWNRCYSIESNINQPAGRRLTN